MRVEDQKTPRNKEKYAALNFKRQVKTRLDQLDTDYLDQLNPEQKDYLNRFLEETVITNFQHKGEQLYDNRKPFYDANNARNRCLYTKAKAMGLLFNASTSEALSSIMDDNEVSSNSQEDAMLESVTLKRSGDWEEEELSPEERAELVKLGVLKA